MVVPLGWGPLNNQPHIQLISHGNPSRRLCFKTLRCLLPVRWLWLVLQLDFVQDVTVTGSLTVNFVGGSSVNSLWQDDMIILSKDPLKIGCKSGYHMLSKDFLDVRRKTRWIPSRILLRKKLLLYWVWDEMKSIIFAARARKSKEVRYTVWNNSDSQHTVPTFIQRAIMLPTYKSGNRTRRINCTHLQSLPHHHRRATFAQRDMPRFTVGRGAPRGLGMPKI